MVSLYRLGFEMCELSGSAETGGSACLVGPTGYPVTHAEWERLKAAVDAFYTGLNEKQLSDLRSALATSRLGHEREAHRALRAAETEAQRVRRAGYVYLLVAETGHYKIGFARQVSSRVCRLGTQTPYRLALVYSFFSDDARAAEKELHDRFKSKRVRGEWFALGDAEVEWFKGIRRWAPSLSGACP